MPSRVSAVAVDNCSTSRYKKMGLYNIVTVCFAILPLKYPQGFYVVPSKAVRSMRATHGLVSHTSMTGIHDRRIAAATSLAFSRSYASPTKCRWKTSSRPSTLPLLMATTNDDVKGFAPDVNSADSGKKSKGKSRGSKVNDDKLEAGSQSARMGPFVDEMRDSLQQSESSSEASLVAREAIRRMEEDEQKRLAARQEQIDRVITERATTEENPDAGVIPEIVANRMLARMIPFFLLPSFGGVGVFFGVKVLTQQYEYSIPAYVVAYATQATFFVALLGITYSILSASWDEDREGSWLGADEVKRNLGNIRDGLKRSSDRMEVEDMMIAEERKDKANRFERRQARNREAVDE